MFKYEMHCHTAETSACARTSAADMVDFYKGLGYTGLVITDHFLNGNTVVPRDLPWRERVERFVEGYRKAKARGDEIGLDVFFGWEFTFGFGSDFLTYGLDESWLLAHPDCDKLHINEFCDLAHESGGYVVHAHPFREAGYIDVIRLTPRKVDAVETINACRTEFENRMADIYAENYGLPKSCGTDNHHGPLPCYAALELDFRAKSLGEIIDAIRAGKHTIKLYQNGEL